MMNKNCNKIFNNKKKLVVSASKKMFHHFLGTEAYFSDCRSYQK